MTIHRSASTLLTAVAISAVSFSSAFAQAPAPAPAAPAATPKAVGAEASVTVTATIQAIDQKNRLVMLKTQDGMTETVYCGPEVQRFNELKVGDKVTFRYYESVVLAIAKPGAVPTAQTATGTVRNQGGRPGATMAKQVTAVVTVLAIDQATPSITVQREDGTKDSFHVEDRKNIEGVKVGDKIQITYTQALAINVQ